MDADEPKPSKLIVLFGTNKGQCQAPLAYCLDKIHGYTVYPEQKKERPQPSSTKKNPPIKDV